MAIASYQERETKACREMAEREAQRERSTLLPPSSEREIFAIPFSPPSSDMRWLLLLLLLSATPESTAVAGTHIRLTLHRLPDPADGSRLDSLRLIVHGDRWRQRVFAGKISRRRRACDNRRGGHRNCVRRAKRVFEGDQSRAIRPISCSSGACRTEMPFTLTACSAQEGPCAYSYETELKGEFSNGREDKLDKHLQHVEPYRMQTLHDVNNARRHLIQDTRNLPAAQVSSAPRRDVAVPSHGSGSFAAVRSSNGVGDRVISQTMDSSTTPVQVGTSEKQDKKSTSGNWAKWIYAVILTATAMILIISMVLIVVFRKRTVMIGPWKTGLSSQLQRAFITGVPKLNRAELEVACEDFSNIIITLPNCTVFKGILSSGVEISVVSTKATSLLEWPERSEKQFTNKIDTLSRINHKNFVNLLGYCHEDDPFMRMMVFEYVPNGTLFEHLHVKEFERLDWNERMRIIMGIAYCLQHMHNLNPPLVHPILHSSSIFMTEDYAAKVADIGIFSEPVGEGKFYEDKRKDNPIPQSAYSENNVYSFGILLLELISGRMPISEEDGLPILHWAADYLKDKKNFTSLVDPTLKSIKENELETICEVVQACIHEDPKSRPTMKEVTLILREALGISPEAAAPRLSPLWWAELEILSVEAS
ncbi:hypothetical protein HPP92_020190 [Vanilla planifolia]|uniref:Protein kinase domain-containing protein n=1 Tax=Vanilla planifolia TaxID=51239 RepID=A0A835Q0T4_VANPL|nr:hypothetical protein HPP92_020190 [Vanilla planifolia]